MQPLGILELGLTYFHYIIMPLEKPEQSHGSVIVLSLLFVAALTFYLPSLLARSGSVSPIVNFSMLQQ